VAALPAACHRAGDDRPGDRDPPAHLIGASLDGGVLVLARDVLGITGIGLLSSLVTGGLLAWILPMGYVAFAEYALLQSWTNRGPVRAGRPPVAVPGCAPARCTRPAWPRTPSAAPGPAWRTTPSGWLDAIAPRRRDPDRGQLRVPGGESEIEDALEGFDLEIELPKLWSDVG